MKYVLIAFSVTLFVVLVFQSKLGANTYPMVMLIYGVMLFVSGGAIKFRPLVAGGVINWVIAVIAFFFPFESQLLLLGVAVFLGYIIPGHLLHLRFNTKKIQTV